jgi:carboxyl-terminal processing protease
MKLKNIKYLFIIVIFFLLGFCILYEDSEKDKVLTEIITQCLEANHYQPQKINDTLSKRTFDIYLKRLDYGKKFLTLEDVKKLEKYTYQIDDQIKNKSFEFFDFSVNTINYKINYVKSFYEDILSKPFDFKKNEVIEIDDEKRNYAKGEKELTNIWRKFLKYQTLTEINDLLTVQEKAKEKKDTTIKIKTFEEIEKQAREKVLKRYKDWFRRIAQVEREDRFSVYINSIVKSYDPHTGYFPPKDKENFDIAMSGRLEGIGAVLQEKDGYIKIVRIVPGSASWKQGELKAGDIILKVAQGEEEPVDIVDMRLDKAVRLIRGKKGTEVRLTIKKLDKSIIVIPIIRDVVIIEETYAKSAILKDKENKKTVGYILLPEFYADFNNKGGQDCANDVKKELEKLRQENINGLILDLRNNGGGSLRHAVDIAGLFIEKGPVVQVKTKKGSPYILQDNDPRIQYKGTLIIMVNYFSASASEILSAAMQDYKRGVIFGSSSTFGKGTVQKLIDLNRYLPEEYNNIKSLGALKLTTQKFYRINGGATQLKGVTPDIVLPDNYTYLDIGEKELDYRMPWDEISPVLFNQWNATFDISKLKEKSKLRVQSNVTFKLINKNSKRLKKEKDKTIYTLNFKEYKDEMDKLDEDTKKYKDIQKDTTGLMVYSLKYDIIKSENDSSKTARIEEWHKGLKKDVYLYEAFSVAKDMIK